MFDWWKAENTHSIDGLPGLEAILNKAGTPLKHDWIAQFRKKDKDGGAGTNKGLFGIDDKLFNGFIVGVSFAALLFYGPKVLGISF